MTRNTTQDSKLWESVQSYQVPPKAVELIKNYPPLLIAGVSSVGKNTITDKLAESSDYQRIVTSTTRRLRRGEKQGVSYWFVDAAKIAAMLRNQSLMEAQFVHGETVYGTPLSSYQTVVKDGRRPLWLVDIYGALRFMRLEPDLKLYFLIPPSFGEWLRRFRERGETSHNEIARRLKTAKSELNMALNTDGVEIVINDAADEATQEILSGKMGPKQKAEARQTARRLLDAIDHY